MCDFYKVLRELYCDFSSHLYCHNNFCWFFMSFYCQTWLLIFVFLLPQAKVCDFRVKIFLIMFLISYVLHVIFILWNHETLKCRFLTIIFRQKNQRAFEKYKYPVLKIFFVLSQRFLWSECYQSMWFLSPSENIKDLKHENQRDDDDDQFGLYFCSINMCNQPF